MIDGEVIDCDSEGCRHEIGGVVLDCDSAEVEVGGGGVFDRL